MPEDRNWKVDHIFLGNFLINHLARIIRGNAFASLL